MDNQTELKDVKLADISVSKTNPRKNFDEDSILELAESIREKMVIQPIILRPKGGPGKYELVCGERRYRASLLVKGSIKTRDTIPSIIRQLNDEEVLQLQIIENLQRKDIHPMDEAVAFKALMAVKGFNIQEISKRIGKSEAYVAQRLKLNDLTDNFQKAFYKNRMILTDALKVARLSHEDQTDLWERQDFEEGDDIEIDSWTLRSYHCDLTDAPFDTTDDTLNKKMGACTKCPFNSASNSLLFPDSAHKAICTNSQCYRGKAEVSYNKQLAEAKEDPSIVLVSTEYNAGKITRDLIAKGVAVLERYKGYEIAEERPEMPEREDFENNNDTKEDDEKEFQEAIKEYHKELQQYETKVASGKFIKAFVVEGDDRGKYIYVTLKKGAGAATSSKAVQVKEKEGTVSAEDIKSEIQRIKDRAKRGLELDEEKKQPLLYNVLKKSGFLKITNPLVIAEKRGLLVFLAEYGSYTIKGDLYKTIGFKNVDDYSQARIYEYISTANEKQLDQWIAIATRILFAHKLSPVNGVRPETNGKAAVLVELTRHYEKKEVEKIEAEFLEAQSKREAKATTRILALNKQLKELPKPATKPNKKISK